MKDEEDDKEIQELRELVIQRLKEKQEQIDEIREDLRCVLGNHKRAIEYLRLSVAMLEEKKELETLIIEG